MPPVQGPSPLWLRKAAGRCRALLAMRGAGDGLAHTRYMPLFFSRFALNAERQ